jgi:hypothetical protein
MDPVTVKAVLDAAFAALEARLASHPWLLYAARSVHALVDDTALHDAVAKDLAKK